MSAPFYLFGNRNEEKRLNTMKFKYIVGALGVISGLFMTTQTTSILCFEPETNNITVQYTDISKVTAMDFTDKEGAILNIQLKKNVGTYKGTIKYKNISHPVSVEVVDQVAPVIIEVNGKYIGYDLLDGILECKVEGDKYLATDKSGNKCEKTVVQAKTKKNGKVQSKPKVQSVQVKSNKPTQATGSIYSYRKLGNFPVLDKKLFGTDTQGMQIGGNEHAWVGVAGCYIDPTFYMTSNGDSKYILSNEIWSDGQH